MIKRFSELLHEIVKIEAKRLTEYELKHRPTIGAMFEGFTKEWLDKTLPLNSPLYVSAGFIVDDGGKLSKEFDCMVVTAEGENVPYTDKKKFKVDDVVAVIQIKKNLYSKDMEDGYQNLLSVFQFPPSKLKNNDLFRDAFQQITRQPLPYRKDLETLPFETQMIYHTLFLDSASPATILLGYNGFNSHRNFRQSFINYVSKQAKDKSNKDFSPRCFPSLIVCDKWSLVKANGMPFNGPLDDDNFWPFYNSSVSNPIELILQIIWTRLVYQKKMDTSVFDDDIWRENFARLISAKCSKSPDGKMGWGYKVTDAPKEALEVKIPQARWEPAFIDETQYVVISRLCEEREIILKDPDLLCFLAKNGYTIDRMVKSLEKAGLAGRYNDKLELLTRGCQCVILPDERFAAGGNIAGQLNRWLNDYMKKFTAGEKTKESK